MAHPDQNEPRSTEPREREVIVTDNGGGGGGAGAVIAAIVGVLVVLLLAFLLFGGFGGGGGETGDTGDSVDVEAPAVDVPDEVNVDVNDNTGGEG